MSDNTNYWQLDMGAIVMPEGVRFRMWAPNADSVDVEVYEETKSYIPMTRDGDGVWAVLAPELLPGVRYKYRLNGAASFPDPYSRSQPEGVHGPSEVVAPEAYEWRDDSWHGTEMKGLIIYECHVGTFSPEGTFDGLASRLDYLVELGVNAIEIMPVAEFPGRRNWGYDGVYLFAPTRNYGGVEGFKRLVDKAHQRAIAIILDVVYNHLGPEGNYLAQFSTDYFTERYITPWGEAINFDGPNCYWARKLFIDNARYWIHEYHVDGLRLDATFKMYDKSENHILQEISQSVHASLPAGRKAVLIAETMENNIRYLLPYEQGGYEFDAVWADDFHHSLHCYLTGERGGYYEDYESSLTELARTINQGFLYEGEWSNFLRAYRGSPARTQPAWQFVFCLQNHDQVGNRAFGDRLHPLVDLTRYRVASALLLLLPYTPLLFMGQEFAASTPFQFFTDFSMDLGQLVTKGRREAYGLLSTPDPQAEETFLNSKLKWEESTGQPGAEIRLLYQQLVRVRREDTVLVRQDRQKMRAGAVTDSVLLVNLWNDQERRLLLANFGRNTTVDLSGYLPKNMQYGWASLIDTNEIRFGGSGEPIACRGAQLDIPGHSLAFLALYPKGHG